MKYTIRYKCLNLVFALILAISFSSASSVSFANNAKESDQLSLEMIAQLPILDEGRIKPLDSFARAKKKYLSGNDRHAMRWLTDTIFNPAASEMTPIIKVTNPEALNMLQLDRRKSKLYSQREISVALRAHQETLKTINETEQSDWSPAQRGVAEIQQKLFDLSDLLASLTPFVPLAGRVPPAGAIDSAMLPSSLQAVSGLELSYLQVQKFQKDLRNFVAQTSAAKGNDIESYSPLEQSIVHLAFSADSVAINGQISTALRVIPVLGAQMQKQMNATMLAPWQMILSGSAKPAHADLFKLWRAMVTAYHSDDAAKWNDTAQKLLQQSRDLATQAEILSRPKALDLEYHVTQLAPLMTIKVFYVLGLMIALVGYFLNRLKRIKNEARFYGASFAVMSVGAVIHVLYICARIYMLQRPPVSTLFESILFVGALVVICALYFYRRYKQNFWLFAAAILGIILQILSLSHDQDGDSMMMLGAVLNTNFWLATHVICITAGYGFCLLTSLLAHYRLIEIIKINGNIKQNDIQKMIHGLALMSLLLTAIGTILGGVWADQSWGRFWGWDPKENGALLIVLWLVWVLHGRISGQMSLVTYTAGLAYLTVITALSWFGVNMLSVGLHSYGFTKGADLALYGFIAAETAFIGGVWWLIRHQQKKVTTV